MFGLRQKILIGFGGLLLIIILLGARSIMQVTDLSNTIPAIMKENYRSVVACQKMEEAIERMDEGVLYILMGYREEGSRSIDMYALSFENALKTEMSNITLPGEGEQSARLQDLFMRYETVIRSLENNASPQKDLQVIYFMQLKPLFLDIKKTSDSIRSMNQQNMYQASQKAKAKAAHARREMYLLLLLGAILASAFVAFAGKWILRPIKRLKVSVDEIRRGNLDLVVKSDSHDEIGHLSEAFNEMTASLREFRRSDEARLVRLQRSAQQTFNSLPGVVAIVDLNGHVDMATETARSIFGLKQDVQIRDLPYRWMIELFNKTVSKGFIQGQKETMPVVQHFHNADEQYYLPVAVPILDEFKQTTGVIIILNDVTEQLEQDEIKRNFVSTVSHQLKTPLTSVRMALHLLLEEKVGTLTPKQSDLLIAAKQDSERLGGIIENLLDISRFETGTAIMEIMKTSPYEAADDAMGLFYGASRQSGVNLIKSLPSDLPDVMADKEQISHVFANLISNALKYTRPGGTVSVSAETLDKDVWFIITDTGSGIPERYLSRIFDRFFRVPGQEERSGTGLGLAIVKEIVEAHGGVVRVKSTEGKGSTFYFSLPKAE